LKEKKEMSQNNPTGGSNQGNQGNTTGGASTGATDAGTTRATGAGGSTGGSSNAGQMTTTGGGAGGTGAGTATGLAATAQEYGKKVADAASTAAATAKDFVADKVSVVGDKLKDLQNTDVREVANQAKDYARQNPGQAILISAAAGLVLGLLIRGSRR
jgi:ElaB/YqjD/DUF883 family membrane-anchored ribosome-binding protein